MEKSYKVSLQKFNCSEKKVRYVADVIRGLPFEQAVSVLLGSKKISAKPIYNLILSGAANAFYLDKVLASKLYVSKITVDSAGFAKRLRIKAKGRGCRDKKRSCSVEIVLSVKSEIKIEQ